MFIRKLVLSNFAVHRMRMALTVAAVALSVSLVVAVTSGYSSLEEAAVQYITKYMNSTDAVVARQNDPVGGVPQSLVALLRADKEVKHADGRIEATFTIPDLADQSGDTKRVRTIGIERPSDKRTDNEPMEAGKWFESADGNDAVVDQSVAEILRLSVGDSFDLNNYDKKLHLHVTGIVHKPAVLAVHLHSIYVPLHTMQKFVGAEGRVSRIMIDFNPGVDQRAFEARWRPKIMATENNLIFRLVSDTRQKMDENLQGVHLMSHLGGAVSMLAATFIVFSALSMGVSERQRSLAMLRAVGAYKSQIAALVIFEGLILALLGVAIGVPLGYLWIRSLAAWFYNIFFAGVVMSWSGIALGSVGSLLAALAASILPAWSATRVDPLEAMSPLSAAPTRRAPIVVALFGLLLISIDPFLLFGPMTRLTGLIHAADPLQLERELKFYLHIIIGVPGLMIGYFLLAPMFVWVLERVAGPVIALLMGLRFKLLRQQLSSGLWRAAGTCAALMVGLAVLVVMQVNGHSMLGGWKLPDKFPDVFIYTNGLDAQQQQTLAQTPGIARLMPISIAAPEYGRLLGNSPAGIGLAAIMPNATMFIGVDPDKVFKMMELDFRDGNPTDATRMLKEGRHLIVTEEFHQVRHLGVGGKLRLKTINGDMDFTIAGVVWSPGMDLMQGLYDMGAQFEQRTGASVFGTLEDGQKYFGIERSYLFAAELQGGVEREQLISRLEKDLGSKGLKVGDVREIKYKVQMGLYHLLAMLSAVGFSALAVASLGVTNTVMAGVRSRRWQFGILRSIGVTRDQLLRLVLAEAVLLGIIGIGLGLAAGMELAANDRALTTVITGYHPPLVIPWNFLIIGMAAVMVVALGASIGPAISVARQEPLELLQAGRAST
jgi:putative ABC transport system permease protein